MTKIEIKTQVAVQRTITRSIELSWEDVENILKEWAIEEKGFSKPEVYSKSSLSATITETVTEVDVKEGNDA